MLRIRIAGRTFELHTARLAETFPRLGAVREELLRRPEATPASVDSYLERRLGQIFRRFYERYGTDLVRRVGRLGQLRVEVEALYNRIVNGELGGPGVASESERIFAELQREMDGIRSPSNALNATPADDLVLAEAPRGPGAPGAELPWIGGRAPATAAEAREYALGPYREHVAQMDGATRALLERAAERLPRELRQRLGSEDLGASARRWLDAIVDRMRRDGASADEIARLREAIDRVNDRHRARRVGEERRVHAERLATIPDPELRAAMEAMPADVFERTYPPETLAELWKMFRARERGYPFQRYLWYLRRWVRGLAGEFAAAFAFGREVVFLKGPGWDVTVRGTDAVAVDIVSGRTYLIDNKAYLAETVQEVSALTRNLPRNLLEDAAAFEGTIAPHEDVPPAVHDAIGRIRRAAERIRNEVTHPPGVDPESINLSAEHHQNRIGEILAQEGIERVVTNSGGNLRRLGFRLDRMTNMRLVDANGIGALLRPPPDVPGN